MGLLLDAVALPPDDIETIFGANWHRNGGKRPDGIYWSLGGWVGFAYVPRHSLNRLIKPASEIPTNAYLDDTLVKENRV
ncbi:unnamed protein product [Pieris macdunnoughi]|uniref:Uncharacterized protein n=1 Tax=Pieris macdunnoughi TaxID=345717 RepID=A0A821V560_9NEOP|nr:unnamed protein product [Pieris macdunnoughi]